MSTDPATLTQLSTFLRDYHHALATGNRAFLAEHTVFPLPFAEAVYDMEAKARPGKLGSVAQLLKARQRLRWPESLVPKGPEDLPQLRRGAEKCSDKAPDVPDFGQGAPAIEIRGDQATLTYLASPCESETHMVTLHFAKTGQTWRLRERSVRVGTS
jgi:hypothetical protein